MLLETEVMTTAQHEQRWIDGLNSGNVSVADEVFHPDCMVHINGGPKPTLTVKEFQAMLTGFLAAFPDLRFTIQDQVTEGHKVSTRWTAQGTHTAPLGELPATGKTVQIDGLIIDYLKNGKVSQRWEIWNQVAMMQQLGILP